MKRFKFLLPILFLLILCVFICTMFYKSYFYKTYDKDLSVYNDKIKELKYNISVYTKDSSYDDMTNDLSYVFEDGKKVAELEMKVMSDVDISDDVSVEMLDSGQSDKLSDSQKQLRRMVEKNDEVSLFSSAWSLDNKSKVVFLSSFYSGKDKMPVIWGVFNADGSLFGIMKATYDLNTRLYSDIKFVASHYDEELNDDNLNDGSNNKKEDKETEKDVDDFSDFKPPGGFDANDKLDSD